MAVKEDWGKGKNWSQDGKARRAKVKGSGYFEIQVVKQKEPPSSLAVDLRRDCKWKIVHQEEILWGRTETFGLYLTHCFLQHNPFLYTQPWAFYSSPEQWHQQQQQHGSSVFPKLQPSDFALFRAKQRADISCISSPPWRTTIPSKCHKLGPSSHVGNWELNALWSPVFSWARTRDNTRQPRSTVPPWALAES